MFDSTTEKATINRTLLKVDLIDGRTLRVSAKLPLSNRISDLFNGSDRFIDIVNAKGEQGYLSKDHIIGVELLDVPKNNQLNFYRRTSDKTVFDPFAVLKLQRSAKPEEIDQAYRDMSGIYDPDRLSAYVLPAEVQDYVRIMQARINLAYEQIRR